MKKKDYFILILSVVVIGLLVYIFCHSKARALVGGNIASNSSSGTSSIISTAHPARRTFAVNIHWIGIVKPQASVKLTALVAGRVESINAKDQKPVERGYVVMRLSGSKLEYTRARLTTKIESLKTQVKLAQETLVRFEKNLNTHLATKAQVVSAQEALVGLKARLHNARLNLKTLNQESCITAPISGVFTNRQVSVGQYVTTGQIVGDIINASRLRIVASLFPPRDIKLQGKRATIRLNANRNISGVIREVLPQTSITGAVRVWIECPQIDAQLHPGEMVEGYVIAESRFALAVPKSAIVYDAQEHPFLFVRKENGYKKVAIQTGIEQDGWIEVLSRLKTDQLVVVKGAYELFYRNFFNKQFKVQD